MTWDDVFAALEEFKSNNQHLYKENARLRERIRELEQGPNIPPEVDYFVDLVAPHVERDEPYYDLLPENRAEIVRAYRKVRPKGRDADEPHGATN